MPPYYRDTHEDRKSSGVLEITDKVVFVGLAQPGVGESTHRPVDTAAVHAIAYSKGAA